MGWINIEFDEDSGSINRNKNPQLADPEIKILEGLYKRSKLGVLPRRPSIMDYEKLQAAYTVR